jgi:hypothetical protein
MSLRINKDNLFFILPEDRYSVSQRIDKHMAKDFTLYVKVKVNIEELQANKEHYIFARNGMHSGISIYKDPENRVHAVYNWWVRNVETGEYEYKNVTHRIDIELENEHNEYIMICDNNINKNIKCYFNDELIGVIHFANSEKNPYEGAFYWFGCGSMLCDDVEHRHIGDFDFDMAFLLDKKIQMAEVKDIITNYPLYTHEMYGGLRKLKDDFYLKDNFAFFCNFDNTTRYKVWDMTFSGNYPQVYIENNIYF